MVSAKIGYEASSSKTSVSLLHSASVYGVRSVSKTSLIYFDSSQVMISIEKKFSLVKSEIELIFGHIHGARELDSSNVFVYQLPFAKFESCSAAISSAKNSVQLIAGI